MYVTSEDGNINYHLRWRCWPLCQSLNARQSPSLHAIGLRPRREGRWCLIARHCPKSRTCSNKKGIFHEISIDLEVLWLKWRKVWSPDLMLCWCIAALKVLGLVKWWSQWYTIHLKLQSLQLWENSFQYLSVSVSMLFLSFGKSYTPSMIERIQDSIVIPESLVRRICLKASKTHTIHLSRCYSIRPLVAHHNSPRRIRCLELHGRLQNHQSSKSFQNLKFSLV